MLLPRRPATVHPRRAPARRIRHLHVLVHDAVELFRDAVAAQRHRLPAVHEHRRGRGLAGAGEADPDVRSPAGARRKPPHRVRSCRHARRCRQRAGPRPCAPSSSARTGRSDADDEVFERIHHAEALVIECMGDLRCGVALLLRDEGLRIRLGQQRRQVPWERRAPPGPGPPARSRPRVREARHPGSAAMSPQA